LEFSVLSVFAYFLALNSACQNNTLI
jgi:hypothetical protein